MPTVADVQPVELSSPTDDNVEIGIDPTKSKPPPYTAISMGVEINEDKKPFHKHSISPDSDLEQLKNYKTECPKPDKKMRRLGCGESKCCVICRKETQLSKNLKRLFCPISWPVMGVIALVVSVMLIMLEFAADTGFCYFNPVIPLQVVPISTPRASIEKKELTVVLFGDSMLLDAAEKFQLAKKVQQFLPDYSFNVSVHANNAVRAKNIRERFMRVLKSKENPDGFIIMTDSDITDLQFDGFSQRKQFTLLSNYSINLEYVVKTIIDNKKWVAIASPCGVLLEVPYFGPPTSGRFHNKEQAINKYTTATVMVTEKMKIPYIDIRNPFLDAIPLYRLGYKGCVTRDGEHANDYGTLIMASKFATVINKWFETISTPAPRPPVSKLLR